MQELNSLLPTPKRENPNPQNTHFSNVIHVLGIGSMYSRGNKGNGCKLLQDIYSP
jgi:hypothetical protein